MHAIQFYDVIILTLQEIGELTSKDELGLIPRICQTMFAKMQESTESSTTFRTEASYLEIYNERVKDLLGASNDHSLKVLNFGAKICLGFKTSIKKVKSLV